MSRETEIRLSRERIRETIFRAPTWLACREIRECESCGEIAQLREYSGGFLCVGCTL